MRDPDRIPYILARLEKAWKRCPDLRLGQLVMNAALDPWPLEDEELISRLEEICKDH